MTTIIEVKFLVSFGIRDEEQSTRYFSTIPKAKAAIRHWKSKSPDHTTQDKFIIVE